MERVKDGPAVNDCLQFRFLHLDFNLLFTFLFQFSVPNFFCICCLVCKCWPCFAVWVAGVQILEWDGRMKGKKVKCHPPPRRSSPQTFFLHHLGRSSSPTWKPEGDHRKELIGVLPFGLGLPAYPAVPKMDSRPPLNEGKGGGRQAIRRRQSTHSVFTKFSFKKFYTLL